MKINLLPKPIKLILFFLLSVVLVPMYFVAAIGEAIVTEFWDFLKDHWYVTLVAILKGK